MKALLIFLIFHVALSNATILEQNIAFQKRPFCPSNGSLAQLGRLDGATDNMTCFSVCAGNSDCVAVHPSQGICYFGNSTQLANLFTESLPQSSDPCLTYVREDVRSKLLVLLDFRQGFSNLISPGTYDATPHGSVTRDAQGAHFPGGSVQSIVQVDTRNGYLVSEYLDHPHNFSFFAKLVRQKRYETNYHYFTDCTNFKEAGRFGDRDGHAWVEHRFTSQSLYSHMVETRQSTSNPLVENSLQALSMGAVFYGRDLNNFYLNGSALHTNADKAWGIHFIPKCLFLGYHSEVGKILQGRMICYAIAKEALSTVEFQQLDRMCEY